MIPSGPFFWKKAVAAISRNTKPLRDGYTEDLEEFRTAIKPLLILSLVLTTVLMIGLEVVFDLDSLLLTYWIASGTILMLAYCMIRSKTFYYADMFRPEKWTETVAIVMIAAVSWPIMLGSYLMMWREIRRQTEVDCQAHQNFMENIAKFVPFKFDTPDKRSKYQYEVRMNFAEYCSLNPYFMKEYDQQSTDEALRAYDRLVRRPEVYSIECWRSDNAQHPFYMKVYLRSRIRDSKDGVLYDCGDYAVLLAPKLMVCRVRSAVRENTRALSSGIDGILEDTFEQTLRYTVPAVSNKWSFFNLNPIQQIEMMISILNDSRVLPDECRKQLSKCFLEAVDVI